MKNGFYPTLALNTIKKNRKLYLPYILTCIGMVMMFYIISSLCDNPVYNEMGGGSSLNIILHLGQFVIAVFAFLFLFYTNSFLVRRRNKEFGLYNVLGMDKRKLSIIASFEALIIGGFTMTIGTLLGILLSKLADLGLMKVLQHEATLSFRVPFQAVAMTLGIFSAIFLVILLSSFIKIRRTNPLDLLKSENVGEKPPKGNLLIAGIGVLLLAGAYLIAVSIKSPIDAFTIFFVAVIMVIIGTYMLFTTGSVTLCTMLKKNKGYYYKKNHFVSISSMSYRMKRNGAGLASICILCTMVLVVMSSTVSLFIGSEDSCRSMYPRQMTFSEYFSSFDADQEKNIAIIRKTVDKEIAKEGYEKKNVLDYRYTSIYGSVEKNNVDFDEADTEISFIPLEDYNKMTGKNVKLKKDEALIKCKSYKYGENTIKMEGCRTLEIVGDADDLQAMGVLSSQMTPGIYLVVGDFQGVTDEFINKVIPRNENISYTTGWNYMLDINGDGEEQISLYDKIQDSLTSAEQNHYLDYFNSDCAEKNKSDFYQTYGGLFFIGILLSLVFMFATVLIIYYKQISEGYEDKENFHIMQMVGMNKVDIKKSINSQILTVFFVPLVFAVTHMAFAFPLIWKILQLFNLYNFKLILIVTICAILVFGLIYAVVYKITSNAYYKIVKD